MNKTILELLLETARDNGKGRFLCPQVAQQIAFQRSRLCDSSDSCESYGKKAGFASVASLMR